MSAAAAAAGTRIWGVRRTGAGRGLRGWDPGSAGTDGVSEGELRVRCRLAGGAGMRVRRLPGCPPCRSASAKFCGLSAATPTLPQSWAAAGRLGVCRGDSARSHALSPSFGQVHQSRSGCEIAALSLLSRLLQLELVVLFT